MTNPMINPQPNYSGVTIQITNPAVNLGGGAGVPAYSTNHCTYPGGAQCYPAQYYTGFSQPAGMSNNTPSQIPQQGIETPLQNVQTQASGAYPPQYYLNNYNYQYNNPAKANNGASGEQNAGGVIPKEAEIVGENATDNSYQAHQPIASADTSSEEVDMTKSQNIIGELDARDAALQAEKKNTKEKRVVALTDEYIKSLENYLNNPNDEIRLMASKEILTRLDEDKDRFDDAALNALLNKMLQDPSKLIRVASLSAFASQLASGNDYTVTLLHNIQANPNADKEDVLQAADILLKMSAGTEIKHIPNPSVKEENENNVQSKG